MRSDGTTGRGRAASAAAVLVALCALSAAAALVAGCGAAASQGPDHTAGPASTTSSSPAESSAASPAADASAVASPAPSSVASVATSPSATPSPEPPPLDRPTRKHPLRVYFGGDSLSGMPGIMLAQLTARSGLARVNAAYVESSRLTSTEPVDWPARLKQQMSAGHYDVGVFMIGANDSGMPMLVDSTSVMYPNKKWLAEYERRARQIAAIMLRSGVKRVYWVGMPIMPSANESKKMRDINKLFVDVAASSPDIVYVDSYDLLSTKGGGFKASLRSGDGVHYTNDGAMVVAKAVWQAIKRDWGGH